MAAGSKPKYYLVEASVLPEIFAKVIEAKELLETGQVRTVADAVARVDISRSAFYPGVGRETARSFHNKVIAVQPSLIPAFETLRGDAVHEAVLARGLKVTGATAYLVDENGGVGPVLLQKAVPVLEDDDLTTLKRRVLTDAEWKLLPEAVKRFCAGKIRLHGGRAQLLE